jgi:hypothetical protein
LTRNLLAELKRRLDQGFYRDNIEAVAYLADEAALQSSRPLPLYVISQVLTELVEVWPEQGIPTAALELAKKKIHRPIDAYLKQASTSELSADQEGALLNDMVRGCLAWFVETSFERHSAGWPPPDF